MPDYIIILIIMVIVVIGHAAWWMGKDIAQMRREDEEIERWLNSGES